VSLGGHSIGRSLVLEWALPFDWALPFEWALAFDGALPLRWTKAFGRPRAFLAFGWPRTLLTVVRPRARRLRFRRPLTLWFPRQ
jgi:hypothetical protein